MWWDLSEIGFFDSLLFSILTMALLFFAGWGIMKLLEVLFKSHDSFVGFDFLQRINLRIFFGFSFIMFIVLLFSIFNIYYIISASAIIGASVIGIVLARREFKLVFLKVVQIRKNAIPFFGIVVLVLVLIVLASQISGFYGSTNDDGAFHSLVTRMLLENPNALLTRIVQPYDNFYLLYPSGTHIICAFLVTSLNVQIQKIVIMISALVPVFIALSFYSAIVSLFNNKKMAFVGLILASFFAIGLFWVPVSWGGLSLLLSLYLTISSIGIVFELLWRRKTNFFTSFLLGLIIFSLSQTYPVGLLLIVFWGILIMISRFILKLFSRKLVSPNFHLIFQRRNLLMLFIFFLPIIFTIPYFFIIFAPLKTIYSFSSPYPIIVSSIQDLKDHLNLLWVFNPLSLSAFFSSYGIIFALTPFSLVAIIALLILKASRRVSWNTSLSSFFTGLSFSYVLMLIILSYLTVTLYLPIDGLSSLFDPQRVWQHLMIIGIILTSAIVFSISGLLWKGFKALFFGGNVINNRLLVRNRVLACVLLGLLLFAVVEVSVPVISDQHIQYRLIDEKFRTFQSLKSDDISLLNWISNNVASDEKILVSGADSGQFVTPVTGRQTVSTYSFLANYTDLMTLLSNSVTFNVSAVPFLLEYNVSYVYIGSIQTNYDPANPAYVNPAQFLSSPYFSLSKEFGDAYLFQFNAEKALEDYTTIQSQSVLVL